MLNKMSEESYLSETTANVTTTMKNDFTENIDASKFDFALNLSSNKTDKKSLLDANITYSSNDLFDLKILNTQDNIGIFSQTIFDKYIASAKQELDNSIARTTGKETNISADALDDTLKNITKNKIELDDSFKEQKAKKYAETIFNIIPEEAVTEKENIVVTVNDESITTNAYTLTLDANKYKEVVNTVLQNLKSDNELLEKIVTGEETKSEDIEEDNEPSQINTIPTIQTEFTEGETETHESELTVEENVETDLVGENEEQQEVSENTDLEISNPETDLVDDTSLDNTAIPKIDLNVESESVKEEIPDLYEDLIKALIFGQKIDGTVQDLQKRIDEEISNLSSIKQGLAITVYVSVKDGKNSDTVKLVADLPNKTNLDIEYVGNDKFKITYLTPEENEDGKEVSVGNSIEVKKESTDVNVKYNIQNSSIENKKVVSKLQIELVTNDANSSKKYTNDAIIKFNNSEGDLKVNIKNEVKFQNVEITDDLTDENAIFLDRISDEEAQNLYVELFQKVMNTYAEKMVSLTFIDNNSSNSVVQQPIVQNNNNEEEKETIRAKLIETVSNMMGEAESNGEEFTIQNLKDLRIDGYEVSSIVSEDLAIIKINGYTFNIDKDFMLSE